MAAWVGKHDRWLFAGAWGLLLLAHQSSTDQHAWYWNVLGVVVWLWVLGVVTSGLYGAWRRRVSWGSWMQQRARRRYERAVWDQAQWDARPHVHLDPEGRRITRPPAG